MTARPQYEIELVGLIFRYWGPPNVRISLGVREHAIRRVIKWTLIVALALEIHTLDVQVLKQAAASQGAEACLIRLACSIGIIRMLFDIDG